MAARSAERRLVDRRVGGQPSAEDHGQPLDAVVGAGVAAFSPAVPRPQAGARRRRWRRRRCPGSAGRRVRGVVVGRRRAGVAGVLDGEGDLDVGQPAGEEPEAVGEAAGVEHLGHQLDVGVAEEPEVAGVGGQLGRPARTQLSRPDLPVARTRKRSASSQIQLGERLGVDAGDGRWPAPRPPGRAAAKAVRRASRSGPGRRDRRGGRSGAGRAVAGEGRRDHGSSP